MAGFSHLFIFLLLTKAIKKKNFFSLVLLISLPLYSLDSDNGGGRGDSSDSDKTINYYTKDCHSADSRTTAASRSHCIAGRLHNLIQLYLARILFSRHSLRRLVENWVALSQNNNRIKRRRRRIKLEIGALVARRNRIGPAIGSSWESKSNQLSLERKE